jgi:hypothetical protein
MKAIENRDSLIDVPDASTFCDFVECRIFRSIGEGETDRYREGSPFKGGYSSLPWWIWNYMHM